jgi:hypothetical protein
MEHIAKVGRIITGFTITDQYIDCICGKELIKLEKNSGDIICAKEIFDKEGFTRNLIADNGQIFINDFCMLYVFNQNTYELLGKWQLGMDLSSDICGMMVDKDTIYCSMRNGKIITVNRQSYEKNEYNVTDSSMWSIKAYDKYLVCGTVDGQVLLLDKATLAKAKTLNLGKQNIGSLCIENGILYAASQDKKIFKINLSNFEIDKIKRNAHKRMFDCIGLYEDMVITVSYPSCEIIFWDKDTLEKRNEINVPLKLSGHTYVENDCLYISSRNILGIDRITLNM